VDAEPPSDRSVTCRVLVVNADRRVRRDLAGLLAIEPKLEVVGSAADRASALAALESAAPNVVVLDPRLPGIDAGLALVDELHRTSNARIVVLCHDASLRAGAIALGADAFITESDSPAAVLAAVRGVVAAG
jgi:DNA-binding NarL/FixJ family response regulator